MHAPSELRESFCEMLEEFHASKVAIPSVAFRDLCGRLWNCSDILPGHLHDAVKELAADNWAGTYGAAARVVRRL